MDSNKFSALIFHGNVLNSEAVSMGNIGPLLKDFLQQGVYTVAIGTEEIVKQAVSKNGISAFFNDSTEACAILGIGYDQAAVITDSPQEIKKHYELGFGCIIGISSATNGGVEQLKAWGADIVIPGLEHINRERIDNWFTEGSIQETWSLIYNDYAPAKEKTRESLLTVGNGYCGIRGASEECDADTIHYPGIYIRGLYNKLESTVADRVIVNEDFVNCPNWLSLTFRIDEEPWITLDTIEVEFFQNSLNFKNGCLHRYCIVQDKQGRRTRIQSWRTASMDNLHLMGICYRVTPLNYSAKITFKSGLDGTIINAGVDRYKQLNQKHLEPVAQTADGCLSNLCVRTVESSISIAETAQLHVYKDDHRLDPLCQVTTQAGAVYTTFSVDVTDNVPIQVDKIVAVYTSRHDDSADPQRDAREAVGTVNGFQDLLSSSEKKWEEIWNRVDIRVEGNRFIQKLIRFNLYHLLITASPQSAKFDAGIPPRGVHGEAYRGHIFWDELFILPLYTMHFPEITKSTLRYRYKRLEKAREYAKEYGYRGAMFPWQSGSDGSEQTQIIHLNPITGTWGPDHSCLQRHVSLAVLYNIWFYYWYTRDTEFLEKEGAELFLEICRFWASKTQYDSKTKRYHINKVMGPDEYHEMYPHAAQGGLNDNSYTNIMVAWGLQRALDILSSISTSARETVLDKIELSDEEIAHWKDIMSNLSVIFSQDGVIAQFDGYFELPDIDWDSYRSRYGDIHRMDRILKAEGSTPDHYKVSKQADVLMTFFNLPVDAVSDCINRLNYSVPENLIKKNFDYYLPRTSHGSTLSRLVHAYCANLIEENELRDRFFYEALVSDYSDIQGSTTAEGVHTGVMAGSVLLLMHSFAGLDLRGDTITLQPSLPAGLKTISFSFRFRSADFSVHVSHEKVTVCMNQGKDPKVDILIDGKKYTVTKGAARTVDLANNNSDNSRAS